MPAFSGAFTFSKNLHCMVNHCQVIVFADFPVYFFNFRIFKFNDLVTGNTDNMIMGIASDLCFIARPVTFKVVLGEYMTFIHQFQGFIDSCS